MEKGLSRRSFGNFIGASAVGVTAPPLLGSAAQAQPTGKSASFPDGFYWGVATAAYQIEGSYDVDGKGMSIWDTYVHTPGKIKNGDTGDVAIDHYKRYEEDVALMKDMGINAYRFSISWPRIFPNGTGHPNQKGLDFYNRLVDELLAAGMEPFATLYHWDLPQALQDEYNGWQSVEVPKAFGEYAGYVASKLSDRVSHFFTINEFFSFVEMGHQGVDLVVQGKPVRLELAPGLKLDAAALNQVKHHAVLGHGLAVQAIRAMGRASTQIGPAENINTAVPVIDSPEHVKAAETATRDLNAAYLGVMLDGKYSDAYLEAAGSNAPKFTDDDLKIIASPLDFVGINVYRPFIYAMASNDPRGYSEVPFSTSFPKMFSSWHLFAPEVLYWAPRHLHAIWGPKAIYITENGCAAADAIAPDGRVYDSDRIMYLRNGMGQLQRATAEGIPVKGNFVWSAMDNFEWGDGYGTRFGMIYVDFESQKRTPKLSAAWYHNAAARNAVV
jgi:beta-glucosidase